MTSIVQTIYYGTLFWEHLRRLERRAGEAVGMERTPTHMKGLHVYLMGVLEHFRGSKVCITRHSCDASFAATLMQQAGAAEQ